MPQPLTPPFAPDSALLKVRAAEDAWNTRNPAQVSLAYTLDSQWRNRTDFIHGRAEIVTFLTNKWQRELNYRLCKELWDFRDNRIAVRFAYEWQNSHNEQAQWFRSYGNELWEFAEAGQDAQAGQDGQAGSEAGLMRRRIASINDLPINERDRLFHWPLGPRPQDHPGLSELGL